MDLSDSFLSSEGDTIDNLLSRQPEVGVLGWGGKRDAHDSDSSVDRPFAGTLLRYIDLTPS